MAETLSTLSIVSFVLAAISLAVAVFLWFFFGIPTVIGDLNGNNARRSIARMRAANEKASVKTKKTGNTNTNSGKPASVTSQNSTKPKTPGRDHNEPPATGLIAENVAENVAWEATSALSEDTTEILLGNETMLLSDIQPHAVKKGDGKKLDMLEEVMLIHTEEVIE